MRTKGVRFGYLKFSCAFEKLMPTQHTFVLDIGDVSNKFKFFSEKNSDNFDKISQK